MARKKIGQILSGGVIIAFTVLFLTLSAQASTGTLMKYTISGNVGLEGVQIQGQGVPGNIVTDLGGYYSFEVEYGWSGQVIPVREGYTFEPAQRTYTAVKANQSNQDYQYSMRMFRIFGNVRESGVNMLGLPGNVVSGSDGSYSAEVEYGWTGSITPDKPGFSFEPASKPYNAVASDLPRQDFTPTEIVLTISGTTSVEGVTMQGLPGNVVTGANGAFTVTVPWGWNGTVTPQKDGYSFIPESIPFSELTMSQTDQIFMATVETFTVSGTTGLAGVEMKGLPGSVFTDENGYYTATVEYGFTGTVTPERAGYSFSPASRMYSNVTSDRESEVYEATEVRLHIKGTTGIDGVQLFGLPGDPITGPGGTYDVEVEYNFTGTATPLKEGYQFEPAQIIYEPMTADKINQNYKASIIKYTISGNVGIANVTMNGLTGADGRPVVTNNNGDFIGQVQSGWNGKITPQKEGYDFSPASLELSDVISDQSNQYFYATLQRKTVSGTIFNERREPIEGILVIADNNGGQTTTDASGKFELEVDYGWSGTIFPNSEGHEFRPVNKTFSAVRADSANTTFIGSARMYTISDKVETDTGIPIPGVTIQANNGGGRTLTDSNGRFTIQVPYGWTGEYTLEKEGYGFNPDVVAFTTPVTQNYNEGIPVPIQPAPTQPTPTQPTPTQPTPTQPTPTQPTLTLPDTTVETRPDGTLPQPGDLPTGQDITAPTDETGLITSDDPAIAELQRQMQEILSRQSGPSGPGAPSFTPPRERLISDTYTEEDLVYALELLSNNAGIPIRVDSTVYGTATCTFNDVTIDQALDIVLAGTKYVYKDMEPQGGNYYLVGSPEPNSPLFHLLSDTEIVDMEYTTSAVAASLLNEAFQPYVQSVPDPNSRKVIVTAPPKILRRIVADLGKLESEAPQVIMLDARIVVLEKGNLLNLGADWNWPTLQAGIFGNNLQGGGAVGLSDFNGSWPWGVQIGYQPDATFTNALEMKLNLLQENKEATITSKPQLVALNGERASFQVITEEYVLLQQQQSTNNYFSSAYFETIESGTTLSITPHVGKDNYITMDMSVEVSDSASAAGTGFPVVTRRLTSNIVRVQDGGTAIVAGLNEIRTSNDNAKVPVLGDMPVVGGLFRSKDNQDSSREIAVFITARILSQDRMSNNVLNQPQIPQQSTMLPSSVYSPQPTMQTPNTSFPTNTGSDFESQLAEALRQQSGF